MKLTAILALALTYVIWAGFLISARAAMLSPLGPIEVGLLRFVTSAAFFIPILWRYGAIPNGTRLIDIVMVGCMGGFLVFGCITMGLSFAPAADSAIFAPSLLPFYVALLSYFVLGERIGPVRSFGIVLILLGAGFVGGWEALTSETPGVWRGHLLFMLGAFCWSIYTIRFRQLSITPATAAMMICAWSAIAFAALGFRNGVDFTGVTGSMLLWQMFMQGFLAGVVALITYSYAVRELGASVSAAFAALVPVLTAIGGSIFLGEDLTNAKIIGIVVVSIGVLLASGALSRFFRRA